MRCLSPRTVGFQADGKTIAWSQKTYNREYAPFALPCGKCLECRLEYARQWATRCVHEAQMHDKNSFITLTYDDKHLLSPKLQYLDFQLFIKRLRDTLGYQPEDRIGYFATGEYGDKLKRPHWHALIFNYRPNDLVYKRSNDNGDDLFTSTSLSNIWGNGITETGDVTFQSAGYCARYAAKKIIHTPNNKIAESDHHEWQPISKKSSKHAIGKKFLEKYWPDIFNQGHIVLKDGTTTSIPRYYEKWLQKHQPSAWHHYVTETKRKKAAKAAEQHLKEESEYWQEAFQRGPFKPQLITKKQRQKTILLQKFSKLQQHLKGDI